LIFTVEELCNISSLFY